MKRDTNLGNTKYLLCNRDTRSVARVMPIFELQAEEKNIVPFVPHFRAQT